MSRNIKFRWLLLAPILVALLVVVSLGDVKAQFRKDIEDSQKWLLDNQDRISALTGRAKIPYRTSKT